MEVYERPSLPWNRTSVVSFLRRVPHQDEPTAGVARLRRSRTTKKIRFHRYIEGKSRESVVRSCPDRGCFGASPWFSMVGFWRSKQGTRRNPGGNITMIIKYKIHKECYDVINLFSIGTSFLKNPEMIYFFNDKLSRMQNTNKTKPKYVSIDAFYWFV